MDFLYTAYQSIVVWSGVQYTVFITLKHINQYINNIYIFVLYTYMFMKSL